MSGESIVTHQIKPSTLNTIKVLHPPQLAPTDPQATAAVKAKATA